MDEQAAFETRAVLAPKRARLSRLALLVPVLALAATAWAGFSGRSAEDAAGPDAAAVAGPSTPGSQPSSAVAERPPGSRPPTEALGLEVRALDELDPPRLDAGEIVAIGGWYFATEITDCPPLAATFRQSPGPEAEGNVDPWRFCQRSGVLFASQPQFDGLAANTFEENRSKNSGLPAIGVLVDEHVVMPAQLEQIGGDATPVVVLGRFVDPDDRCHWPMDCPRQLVVDHVAWSAE